MGKKHRRHENGDTAPDMEDYQPIVMVSVRCGIVRASGACQMEAVWNDPLTQRAMRVEVTMPQMTFDGVTAYGAIRPERIVRAMLTALYAQPVARFLVVANILLDEGFVSDGAFMSPDGIA